LEKRVLVCGPLPPPHNGISHVIGSFLKPPFSEALHVVAYDTKLRDNNNTTHPDSRGKLLGRALTRIVTFQRAIAAAQPDLVLLCTGASGRFWQDVLLLRACQQRGVPTIIRFFGGVIHHKIQNMPVPVKRWIVGRLARASALLVETNEMARGFRSLCPQVPVYRVPNFIHGNDLPAIHASAPLSAQTGIIYVGNITPTKGVETILASVDRVCAEHRAALHFVGGEIETGYLDHFRSLARSLRHADAVHIHGRLPREEAHALTAQCRIFAFPTQWHGEGQPAALLEAMGMGLVPVATPWRGVAEIVRDGFNGLSIARPDPEALAAAILRLLEDRSLLQTLSCNARETVLTEYEAAVVIAQYRRIITDVLQGEGASLQ
jgi:glycosyltransferase involved in cell wall biosynthesis